ncbi:MAG TPA: cellulase family glycosylhydrolase, partial [Nitrolancea sp.]|nr:cellulase family glycosylhydrolase [Nitrolancea sp.]
MRWLLHRRWVRVTLHLLVLVGLLASLGATPYAEPYFSRGVDPGTDLKPIPHTDVNPLGVNTFLNEEADPAKVKRTLDMIAAGGFTFVRQMFAWYEIEPERDSYYDSRHNISAWEKYDRIVDLATERDLELIVRLDKAPLWAREGQPNLDRFLAGPPNDDADYAEFVAAVVNRYRGRIHYIQIWNEPNLEGEWGGQAIDPARFTRLLKAAYTAAKQADPNIVVLMPGLAPTDQTGPTNLSDLLFLQGMYDAGAKDYFDVASAMVYGYGYTPNDRRVEFARNNFSRVIQTRDIMVRNGDADKPVWASEYGWVTLPQDWTGDPSPWGKPVTPAQQADYLYQGYLRAQREWPWMGVMCVWNFQWIQPPDAQDQIKNPTRGFSIVNYDYSPQPAYALLSRARGVLDRAYIGAYPASSRLIEYDDGWALRDQGGMARLVPQRAGARLRVPFSGSQFALLVSGSGADFTVSVDGEKVRLRSAGTASAAGSSSGAASRELVVDGLSDGHHLAEVI